MTLVRKLSNAVYSLERILAFLLFIFMVTLIILGVVFRYFFNSPLSWSDEYALYALVWITFIGGSMSIKKRKSAAVSFVMERIPRRISQSLVGFGALITLLFCLFILYISFQWITNPVILLQKSSAGGLPMIIPYLAIPLGFLFVTLHSLDIFAGALQSEKREGS